MCPKCRKTIRWFDNIPVISFILLKGRCRNCGKKISIRYPVIELFTAVGFFIIGWNVFQLVLFVLLELIFIIDLEHQIIPDDFVFFGMVLVFIVLLLAGNYPLFSSLFSGFLAASLLMFLHLITRGRGMGLGDVKFAVLGGMIVGLRLSLIWLFLAFLTGGLVGIILILGRRVGLKDKIAFGPFLVIGIFLAYLIGDQILRMLFI